MASELNALISKDLCCVYSMGRANLSTDLELRDKSLFQTITFYNVVAL